MRRVREDRPAQGVASNRALSSICRRRDSWPKVRWRSMPTSIMKAECCSVRRSACSDRLSFGIAYGGTGVIGSSPAVMNQVPGFTLRVRPLEESLALPALLSVSIPREKGPMTKAGADTRSNPRASLRVLSKNFLMLGYLHAAWRCKLFPRKCRWQRRDELLCRSGERPSVPSCRSSASTTPD